MDTTDRAKGVLLTTLGVLILTPDAVLIRLIEADPWTLLFWRGLVQGLALVLGYLVVYRARAVPVFCSAGRFGLLIGLNYAIGNMLFIHSIRTTSVANTLLILSTSPLIAAVYSRVFLKERTPGRTWLAAAVALAGVAILFSGSGVSGSVTGDLLAFVAACCMAGSFVMIRAARVDNMIPAVAISGLFIALLAFPFAPVLAVTPRDAAWLLVLGGFVIPVAFALITLGPRYISAPEVSLLMLIETALGPTWVWLFLGEVPSVRTLVGGAVLLGALVVHTVVSMRCGER